MEYCGKGATLSPKEGKKGKRRKLQGGEEEGKEIFVTVSSKKCSKNQF